MDFLQDMSHVVKADLLIIIYTSDVVDRAIADNNTVKFSGNTKGVALAECIQAQLGDEVDSGISDATVAAIAETVCPTLCMEIELGSGSSPVAALTRVAQAVVAGITSYAMVIGQNKAVKYCKI
ncbi:hypothetical protein [Sporomusa sphaeroides]|uniref:hypothetical protein n=1 Tax=Sporomusa sphaeroides TaxID=47679 RepID=UPI0032D573B4